MANIHEKTLNHLYTNQPMDTGRGSLGLFHKGSEKRLLVLHMYNKNKICCVLGNLVIFEIKLLLNLNL